MKPCKRFVIAALVVFSLQGAAACNKREAPAGLSGELDKAALSQTAVDEQKGLSEAEPGAPTLRRKVITSWELSLETSRVEEAFARASSVAKDAGGWITGSSRRKSDDGRLFASLEMRIPPGKVSGVLDQLHALGSVMQEDSTGEDITEAYYDLEARMKNQKAAEERLLLLLSRRADKLSDVLAVERELVRVRGEIESMEARKRNWDLLTDTVSIRVGISEPARALPAFRRVWDPVRTALGDALEGFANSLHFLVVFLGVAAPWLALGILVFVLLRIAWKNRGKV